MTVVDNVTSSLDSLFFTVTDYSSSHASGIVAILLLLSMILTFSGRTLLRPTVFLTGLLPTTTLLSVFGLALLADHETGEPSTTLELALQATVVVFSLILGVLVGIVMVRLLVTVFIVLVSGIFGLVLTTIVYLILLQPASTPDGFRMWIALAVILFFVCALLAMQYSHLAVVLGTALDGSAAAIYCVAVFLGHPPSVFTDYTALAAADDAQAAAIRADRIWAAAYSVLAVALAIFGAAVQQRVYLADKYIGLYIDVDRRQREEERARRQQEKRDRERQKDGEDQDEENGRLISNTTNNGNANKDGDNDNDATVGGEDEYLLQNNQLAQLKHYQSLNSSLPYTAINPHYLLGAGAPQYAPVPNNIPSQSMTADDNQPLVIIEPPRSPAYRQASESGGIPPGAEDNGSDVLVRNLSNDPLTPSIQPYRGSDSQQ